ncbi:MAG: RecX family transcriptional regulator [Saprospiraceae bacterium]|nr:RecX family transcriptional regulator [Saprospiraceae bacterium]
MKDSNKKKWISRDEALLKLQWYCVYQDRCHQEVRRKGRELGVYADDLEEIITELIQGDFLNEERFARSYARGKFRMKKWGRNRIQQELKYRHISDYCIRMAMQEIDDLDNYNDTIVALIQKKADRTIETNLFKKRAQVAQYVIRKGYEPDLVWKLVKEAL